MTQSVALVYCHGEAVKAAFMSSIIGVMAYEWTGPNNLGVVMGEPGAAELAYSRNNAVRRFLKTPFEWLWFVDADIAFKPDTLQRMLSATSSEHLMVAAAYWRKTRSGNTTTWSDENLKPVHPAGMIMELGHCPMGCVMIHRQVLEDVAAAWKHDPWPWFAQSIFNGKRLVEDLAFCARARSVGHKIWGVGDLVVEHHKLQPLEAPPEND